MMEKISSTRIGARPIDGSSSSSSFGRAISPRPIASICCSPPERVPPSWVRRSFRRGKLLNDSLHVALDLGLVLAGVGAHLQVLLDGQRREDLSPFGHVYRCRVRTIFCAGMEVSSSPRSRTVPVRGRSSPEMVLSVVDLPAPLAPIKVTISPSSTSKLMPCSAWIAP